MSLVYNEKKCAGCPKVALCKQDGGPLIKMLAQEGIPTDGIADRFNMLPPAVQMDAFLMLMLMGRSFLPTLMKLLDRVQPAPTQLPAKA